MLFLFSFLSFLQANDSNILHDPGDDPPILIGGDPCDPSGPAVPADDCYEFDPEGHIRWVPCRRCIEFSPVSGVYGDEVWVTIVHHFGSEAVIRYTLDGRDPAEVDPIAREEAPILINGAVTIKASAWKNGVQAGEIESAWYQFFIQPLIFSPPGGTVSYGAEISVTCPTPEVEIFYTLDSMDLPGPGMLIPFDPAPSIRWIPYVGPIPVLSNMVITARAERPGYIFFNRPGQSYQLPRLPRPDFHPSQGPITNGTPVAIISSVPEATIRYTLDGTEPTSDSPEYKTPLPLEENTPLRSRLFLHGFNPSHIRYTFFRGQVEAPAPRPAGEEWPVLLFTQVAAADRPVFVAHAGDGTDRLFFVEQSGKVGIVGRTNSFLDISSRVAQSTNLGMVSVAFPPAYDSKGHFYVSYYGSGAALIISRFSALANPNVADPDSEEVVLQIPNPYGREMGGQIAFGPEGFLYVAIGDPGWAHEPARVAQDPEQWHGKILRIDVEGGGEPYGIPASNPFLADERYRPEIWAVGLRSPFRFSFDRFTGDLIVADAGQSVGEINIQPAASPGGENYGWPLWEGTASNAGENPSQFKFPAAVHPGPGSIVGGIRYRGLNSSRLNSVYIFGDNRGTVAGLRLNGTNWAQAFLANPQFPLGWFIDLAGQLRADMRPFRITAFGEDESGRIYVANYGVTVFYQEPPSWHAVSRIVGGGIYLIADDPLTFSIRSRIAADSQVALEWQSAPEMTYQMQISRDLVHWEDVELALTGTGEPLSVPHAPAAGDTSCFFRIVATPHSTEQEQP
jgi:hypothetical protein